jgi:hypothetical protein
MKNWHAHTAALLIASPVFGQVPDTVSPPKALNLGSTSFFDGFGRTDEGFTLLQYGRYEDLDRITDYDGHNAPSFKSPSIQVFSSLTQISYTSNWHPLGGDAAGFSAALPLVSLNSSFAANSPVKLSNNGFGVGDLVWGPLYQSRLYRQGERPVFSWRFQLMILSPTGNFSQRHDINQSAGFWAVNPYLAMTVLPTKKLEFSTRLNYQYNLRSSNFADPPPVPGLIYRSGQAGQIVYGNIAGSYEVADKIRLGVNGYFLHALNQDQTNGLAVRHSEVSAFAIGPGARYTFDKKDFLNANVYFPIESCNGSPGPTFNVQYIHRF